MHRSKRLQDVDTSQMSMQDVFMSTVATVEPLIRSCDSDDSKKLFTFKDVLDTTHPLARILRMVLADNNVTNIMFEEKHREYAEQAGFLSAQIGYNRNNIKKGMNRPKVTWPMLEAVLLVILGYGLDDLILKLRHPVTNEICEYSLQGILNKSLELYGSTTPTMTSDNLVPPMPTFDTHKG